MMGNIVFIVYTIDSIEVMGFSEGEKTLILYCYMDSWKSNWDTQNTALVDDNNTYCLSNKHH